MGQGQGRLVGGRYRLTAVVGRGGMGTVWRAHDEVLDRDVAVKEVIFPPGIDEDQQNVLYQRTYREARASARLNHPGVVTVHDVVQEDGRPWIVMEFVAARPLQEIIDQDGPLPPGRVAEIGQQLLEALNHAHAAGIMHRDVKPSNVMIAANGRAVLTDFGIAQMPGQVTLTQTGLVMGSPAYIAPERAQGNKAMPASDLWALGATLYAAVEGRSPYEREDLMATLAATLTEDPPPPRRAGRLGPVIEGLLVRDPARRMPAAAALPLLADVAFHDPINRPPSTAGIPPQAPPGRYRGAWYGPERVEETHRDGPRLGRHPVPSDVGSADTVQDPPVPDDAALLTSGQFTPGPSYRVYDQTQSADQSGRTGRADTAAPPDISTQNRTRFPGEGVRPRSPSRLRTWLKGRRFVFGGVAFAVGITLIAAGLLLWPRLTGPDPNPDRTGATGATGPQVSPSAVPPGFKKVTGTGYSLAVPADWVRAPGETSVFWRAPNGQSVVQIDTRSWDERTSNEHALRAETDAKRNAFFSEYRRSRISETTYQGQPATDWEFTYTEPRTPRRKLHAQDRFVRLDGRPYTIYFRTLDSQWLASAQRLAVIYNTFQATG